MSLPLDNNLLYLYPPFLRNRSWEETHRVVKNLYAMPPKSTLTLEYDLYYAAVDQTKIEFLRSKVRYCYYLRLLTEYEFVLLLYTFINIVQ